MRRVIEQLGRSALRSRLGVAIVLAIVVFGVVGMARALSGPDEASPGTFIPADPVPTSTIDPTTGDDGVVEPDDGVVAPEGTATPDDVPGGAEALTVAKAFANDWLDRDAPANTWYAALKKRATPDLAAKLKDVDPVVVPAERLTGEASLVPRSAEVVEVAYPVDSGVLRLRLVTVGGAWLVDGVDWERA